MAALTQQTTRIAGPLLFAARLAVAVLLAAVLPAVGPAQGPAPALPVTQYINKAQFEIPFNDPNDRNITMVHLCVSEDRGKTYDRRLSARPNGQKFLFTAAIDGLYYFTTQVEDVNGKLSPPNPAQFPPMLILQIHTKKPVITLKQVQASHDGYVAVEWDIRDDYLDPESLLVDYRAAGGWKPLPVDRKATGFYEWSPGINGQVEVKFRVANLAKTTTEQTIVLNGNGKPGPAPAPGAGLNTPAPDNTIWVHKRNFTLDYKLEVTGPSGVPKIEVWQCSPSLEWQKLDTRENEKAKPPLAISAPGEGRYGFTLIPVSGVDLAMPRPMRGDAPQVWVEVDETPPTVRIARIEVGRGADTGDVTINWDATDNRQLAAKPISIYYMSSDRPNEWIPIATQLPNTRTFVWGKAEKKPFQCQIKVEAIDMAGNVGRDTARESVKIDPTIPTLKITEIKAVPSATPNPPASSPP